DEYDRIPPTNPFFHSIVRERRMHADAPETAIHSSLAPKAGDITVRKTRVGAFSTTNLADQLRARNIRTLVLAGISTSGVVLSTIRDAADHDNKLYVLKDACADRDPQVHEVLLEKVFPRQATIISVADLPAILQEGLPAGIN
ncbi:MAG: cysteine hydrolase family protein, partial [Acidobacteriaceae bacterium]